MTEKQYYQALANLSDRYLFENMSNREYVEQRKAIETNYLKTWVECPSCKMYSDQKVIKSERNSKFITIRRRLCYECGHKWFTIQYPEMIVPDIQARYASRE